MNLLELQTRANALVQKVNEYEETIAGVELDEDEILNEHTYVDLFSLRMIMHRLFGKTPSDRSSNLTTTDGVTWYYLPTSKAGDIHYGNINENSYSYGSYVTIKRLNDNNDLYTNYNIQVVDPNLSNAWEYSDTSDDKERLITSMSNTVFGADIRDALVTESQTANIFKWNTTSEDDVTSYASAYVVPQQVPGIVCYYLGSGYDGTYTATVPFNTSYSTNQPNNATPALYGAYYIDQNVGPGPEGIVSQQAENRGAEGLRMFMPGLTYFNGTSISPINIWQPFPRLDTNYGYNYQGKALYHELVFKRRRAGCKEAGLDFIPDATVDNGICDNDPQGLAMRLALAQQKPYYYNRPWFTELDELYTTEGTKQAALADKIIENSKEPITEYDTSVYNKNGNVSINEETTEATNFSNSNYLTYTTPEITAEPITQFIIRGTFTIPAMTSSFGLAEVLGQNWDTSGTRAIRMYSDTSTGKVTVVADGDTPVRIRSNRNFNEDDIVSVEVVLEEAGFVMRTKTSTESSWTVETTASRPDAKVTDINTTFYLGRTSDGSGSNYPKMIRLSDIYLEVNNKVWIETPSSEVTSIMTDSEFYSNYQLSYDTYAEALGEPQ